MKLPVSVAITVRSSRSWSLSPREANPLYGQSKYVSSRVGDAVPRKYSLSPATRGFCSACRKRETGSPRSSKKAASEAKRPRSRSLRAFFKRSIARIAGSRSEQS